MTTTETKSFADRMYDIPESFIREILKVSTQPGMISFAGGLPNPEFFPVEKIAAAAEKVLRKEGRTVLQYAPTEGYLPLRDYIAQRQGAKEGIKISAEQVLILNGAQQGLDLTGKLFLNKGTDLLLEAPSYLGAIQAFSVFQPTFNEVDIRSGGPDLESFASILKKKRPVLFYCIPNFQNPTGNTYDLNHRQKVASALSNSNTILLEDDPYGEIYFDENNPPSFHSMMPDRVLYLGSFSKIISPGLRLGWATGSNMMMRKMAIAKQASDLHSNNFAQRVVFQFLMDIPLDQHLGTIKKFYKTQAADMMRLMRLNFADNIRWNEPRGGMFTWITLPAEISASALLEKAIERQVLFVPGQYFYAGTVAGTNCLRMNFSNPSKVEMERGIKILGDLLKEMGAY